MTKAKKLNTEETITLLNTLQKRFETNTNRHPKLNWEEIQAKLEAHPDKLWPLQQMETSGGEPDVVGTDEKTGQYLFYDCAPESPKGRRSLCYDRQALEDRKKFKPENSAIDLAEEMGIQLLNEAEYNHLQSLGEFDTKTSSWLKTPKEVRDQGGAIFGDYRFGRVFFYHNGASSYYAARGFRGCLKI
ncbi:MAG: DUF4256 domain-containing protein [Bacteroidetes bacterium]|nr:DUF4256 domain-containing protein [Bacteroidota bacterium]